MPEFDFGAYELFMTINVTAILVGMLAACLCCRKKVQKEELTGLEGMVKLKNPDEVIISMPISESQTELNASIMSTVDSEKRASTAAFRSLPDIPIVEHNDNNSELYETVADKSLANGTVVVKETPTTNQAQQASVSQHSSLSQADDVSSPYSRVKNMPHDYAKVRNAEHPYAQLNAPSTSAVTLHSVAASNAAQNSTNGVDTQLRGSQISEGSNENVNEAPEVEIPAASAIAGMISASQDLPYMTPPILNQHFSGDSQDSSKGYTSISVREPLANILAQQPPKATRRNAPLSRDANDSHYATVSDDSDETYAAIEDPNSRNQLMPADIYTSGSETYAQIQPLQANSIVVAVEINNCNNQQAVNSSTTSIANTAHPRANSVSSRADSLPVPTTVDSLRTQMHSRQPSSSSNISSIVCNLGSPKPEKRQANSPLPPTPKYNANQAQLNQAGSNSNLTSGHSSIASVIGDGAAGTMDGQNTESITASPQKNQSKTTSPSKNFEGMYAKVNKKNKLAVRHASPTHGNSPIMERKRGQDAGQLAADTTDSQNILTENCNEENRTRRKSYSAKDHGYETIPGEKHRNAAASVGVDNRKSDCYTSILQKERLKEASKKLAIEDKPPNRSTVDDSDKHYETLHKPKDTNVTNNNNNNNEPGYAKVKEQTERGDCSKNPGYARLNAQTACRDTDAGYEQVREQPGIRRNDPGYESVKEKKPKNNRNEPGYECVNVQPASNRNEPGYASVREQPRNRKNDPGYESVKEQPRNRKHDPGYESVKDQSTCNRSEPGYASVKEQPRNRKNDPGYEAVKKQCGNRKDDPNYESVKEHSASNRNEPGYACVNEQPRNGKNDPGYESVKNQPASRNCSDPGYEKVKEVLSITNNDPGYEKVKERLNVECNELTIREDFDVTYEAVGSSAQSDDGYAKVLEKTEHAGLEDATDGYSKIKGDGGSAGYETIAGAGANHNYASILETKQAAAAEAESEADHYARISENTIEQRLVVQKQRVLSETQVAVAVSMNSLSVMSSSSTSSSSMIYNSSTITTATTSLTTKNSGSTLSLYQYGSLSGSETDPNYESVRYSAAAKQNENSYEKLLPETASNGPSTTDDGRSLDSNDIVIVDDCVQV